MKLKHRLSLYSVTIFTIVMLLFSAVIYFSYYTQMEKKEKESLESKSLLAAIYYLEKDELSFMEHTNIQNQLYKAISRRNIAVFDSANQQSNGDMMSVIDISIDFLEQVRQSKNAFFDTESYFYNGIFYHDNQGDFVVVTREPKEDFKAQMFSLFKILLIAFLLGIVFIFFFSQYLSYIAYQPIIHIIKQIKERDTRNFNQPLQLSKTYAEVNDLVETYNHFVKRIADTFHVQKNFIDYVSHELRTPITALLGTLEVTKNKSRTEKEYRDVIEQLQQYTTDLQETLDKMMLLSGAKTNFEFNALRIDEVVWQLIENMVLYHQAHLDVDIQVQDTNVLTVKGNDKLLELAIGNILENAIKYSDNQTVRVVLQQEKGCLLISVMDKGIGIPQNDLANVRQNFYRAANTKGFQGKGVGLSIANVIFTLHGVEMKITSTDKGTTVCLYF
ncbi:sensor histidine kinase [Sphingobacterium wenxiniae]|uniref:histidine kinase n=1 Tax=Sphingobacterium wenxiniae TaxID=683125 RepID=A0A1I6P239_9SPHI|nr:HAMP domain-containing sensor histidine kinase [Sphingobacterium wenxiniae]SFS34148.1 Signal transduction histidine kinase [Sphingobacterium wenxiniae]